MSSQGKSDKKTKFVQNLEFLLASRGLSQRELAQGIGLSQATVSLWVKGSTTPKSGELEKLSNYFDITMDALWRGNIDEEELDGLATLWRERARAAESKLEKLIPACQNLAESARCLTDILDPKSHA